ncbi:hypothetical protein EX30DRAFT_337474 [Ascodesmis nigricans]|uniref:DASH complex subunit DAM1 n=1 Tax=Ascodesmis nigricans TaxID=341454 RepID=A0A4S2N7E0_9PEZI|nr:hypothetical protein EX30DRAFT_337474 [Ascodesmis nigricans]
MSTPEAPQPSSHRRPRSSSRGPRSRPTTPLRHSSRSRANSVSQIRLADEAFPLNGLEGGFAELSDSLQMLSQNLEELSLMHQSISRFSENFAAFLYGMNMNAFCADFTEAPADAGSFKRNAEREERRGVGESGQSQMGGHGRGHDFDMETTFMTNDTSFVNEPPPPTARQAAPTPMKPPVKRGGGARGGIGRGARGTREGTREGTSGIARGRGSISYR